MDRIIGVHSNEIRFKYEPGKMPAARVHIHNLMQILPVAFKVVSTAPRNYKIQPAIGVIPPLGDASFQVEITAPESCLSENPPFASHKFYVKGMIIPSIKATEQELDAWFATRKHKIFTDATLKLVLTGSQILCHLASTGGLEALKEVVKDTDVNQRDKQDRTALYIAAVRGHVDIVKFLLTAGADTNARNSKGWTPLHAAASRGDLENLSSLLDAGADVDASDNEGRTPLHEAAMEGHTMAVSLLLGMQRGADVEKRCHYGWTALHNAAVCGHVDTVELLVKEGANCRAKNSKGKAPCNLALENGHLYLLDALYFRQVVQKAARTHDFEKLKHCLLQGASVEAKDHCGWTCLHRASFKGHLSQVKLLLEYKASINSKDNEGYTPLHCAIEAGHKEVLKYLLQHGADTNARTNKGLTPLSLATHMGCSFDIIKMLKEKRDATKSSKYQLDSLSLVTYGKRLPTNMSKNESFGYELPAAVLY